MFPDLALVSGISVGLSYYNYCIAAPGAELSIGMGSFAGITTAIGMLAGFRLNASYGRYEECRIFWGETNNTKIRRLKNASEALISVVPA